MTLLSFDGNNLKSIDRGFADVFYPSSRSATRNATVVGGLTPNQVYAMVARVFRCVNKRSGEVSRVPRALEDASGKDVTEQYKDLMLSDDFIASWAASRYLSGRSYAILDVNAYGMNAKPRWVISTSVTAVFSGHPRRLQYFQRSEEMNPKIDPARMLWQWSKNYEREDEPGPGEAEVALGSASSLYAINGMLAGYFNGGAVKVTVFPVLVGTPDKDREEFQNWLNRRLSGVRNAFKNIVMRTKDGELKPVVIGSDIKDTQASEISKDLKDDIAEAFDIPPNVVSGNYKYSTADSEYIAWIIGSIIPECDRMFERLTEQYYSRYGLRLVSVPKKMEVLQTAQLAQIVSASAATGNKPIMLIREAREIADLDNENLTVDELKELGLPLPKPVAMVVCPNCVSANPAASACCSQCGAPLGQALTRPVRVMPSTSGAVIDNQAAPALNSGKPVKVEQGQPDATKPARVTKAVDVSATIEALKAWREDELKTLKDGTRQIGVPAGFPLSPDVYEPVVDELIKAKTAKSIRAVFERAIAEVKATQEPEPVSDMRYLADALLVAARAVEVSE
jgi:hypothetical protein